MPETASRPRRAPPWWPEGEEWPPKGPGRMQAWRMMRGRYWWRIGAVFVFFIFVAMVLGTIAFWLVATGLGFASESSGVIPGRLPVGVVLVVAVTLLAFMLRSFRRAAEPVADLLEAAGKVEAADYSVRVRERGTREVRALIRAFNAMVESLQSAETQRRNLLADVTHELRTPLTIIQGNLEGLLDGVYPRDDAHLEMILDETRIFSRLVEDLRTLAQAESGILKLNPEPTDLNALLREAVSSLAPQADSAGVTIIANTSPTVQTISVDPLRIRAVVVNLLVNALRYTPSGGTIVVISRLDAIQKCITVSVADSGAGIPSQVLPHIFDRFFKSDDSRGSGLGLAIGKYLVMAHRGQITATSEVGKGTTITFTLPVGS